MSVSFTGGIDYSRWKPINNESYVSKNSPQYAASEVENDQYISSSKSAGCTDGKDDGKIGFFSAIGNAIKGVGKTIVNGVKGMFTNKEGKFSLGKTLLSLGTAALCIAVPAVGVAACVIGGTMGAVQVGKGIYHAATADTDAEAKAAWQDIGGGAFTVGMSVVGAKAGVKGMKTAAANTSKGSALQSLESAGTKLSAKTIGQYGKAFLQDGYRSGKYNLGQIKTSLSSGIATVKELKELNSMRRANAKALAKQAKGETLTDAELKAIADWENLAPDQFSQSAYNIANKQNTLAAKAAEFKEAPIQSLKNAINPDRAAAILKEIRHPINAAKKLPGNLSAGAKAVLEAIKSTDSTYAQLVQKYGFENVAEVLELYGGFTIANEAV